MVLQSGRQCNSLQKEEDMKGSKKVLSVMMAAVLAMGLMACGSEDTQSTAGTAEAAEAAETSEATQAATTSEDGEDVTLTVWSIATESDAFHPAYLKAIEDFEADHPGVTIDLETFENESYKTKIKSAVAANELPDVFFTWGGGFSTSFVESGKVLPLDDYYPDYQDGIPKAALGNATYDGIIYGSAISTPVSCLFYNKTMFEKEGLEVPETWDEFQNVCQTFIDDGITPLGVSVKDTWVLAMTHDALTLKSAGAEKTAAAVTRTEGVSYNDPDFLASATKIKELVDMGAFSSDATGLSNDEASQQFYTGEVPMYITGSWMAGSIQTDTQNPDDFDVAPIPVINSDNAALTDFMGGASDTLMASASSQYPDLAAEAVFELTRGISHYSYLDGAGIPAWTVDYDASEVNAMTQKIADYTTNATSFTLWFDTLMSSEDAGEYLALLQQLYIGDLTPEEFVEAMAEQLGN